MTKWSGVPVNNSPALADYLMGVTSSNVDDRITIQNLVNLILKTSLLSNQYKFSAYKSIADGSQTIGTSYTKVTFPTIEFDTGGNFASSRFTAPVAGYYYFSAIVQVSAAASLTRANCSLYKNGVQVKEYAQLASATGGVNTSTGINYPLLLAAGDFVEAWALGGGATFTSVGSAALYTEFSGFMISAT